jgi:signal transduction histidine kinase
MKIAKATITALLYTSKTLANGEHPVMIRVCYNGKRKYKSTGLSCPAKLWNTAKQEVRGRHPLSMNMNALIESELMCLKNKVLDYERQGMAYSVQSLLEASGRKPPSRKTLDDLFEERIAYFIWRYFTNKKIFEQRLELERIKEQNMKQLTQARINFFTNISHDLKTPLTLVVDPLKQLKEHLPANAPGNAYVHLIEKNVGRIQRMISQLLQFREIESQKITLNRQPGDLIRFIDSIFSLFEFYANKKGIETGFNSQYESFYTKFDHDVIEKIFTNLFSNAIKYASENFPA